MRELEWIWVCCSENKNKSHVYEYLKTWLNVLHIVNEVAYSDKAISYVLLFGIDSTAADVDGKQNGSRCLCQRRRRSRSALQLHYNNSVPTMT